MKLIARSCVGFVLALLAVHTVPASSDYLVGAEDVLSISVYEHPDLQTLARVENDGTIQFPLVGEVSVEGKAAAQISRDIERKLADGFLVEPHVTVFVQEFKSRTVVVMGQVRRPGMYELSGPLTVVEAVSKAGGFTDIAAQRSVKILRNQDGVERSLGNVDMSTEVLPDDVIVVPESLF